MEKSELPPMKKIIRYCFFLCLLIICITACYYDNEENLNPVLTNTCDFTSVTYTLKVKPVLQSFCLSCHSTAAASASGGGIRLENYTDLKTYVSNGKFYGSVSHASGYSAMPKGGSILDVCTLKQLKKWIDDGALNN
jgi:hypothetical protein